MEVKKTKKADLERKRSMFMQVGFVLALGAALVAFEWKTTAGLVQGTLGDDGEVDVLELPPIVRLEEPEPPAPKPQTIPIEQIIIVDDMVEIPEELDFTSESNEEISVELSEMALGDEDNDDPIPFFALANKPEFPGGERALLSFLSKSVKYPVIAQENGIQGTVYLSFVIGRDGAVRDVKVVRGVDSSLNKEASRVVSSMPKWKPGKQGTKSVSVSYQVPINFRLQ